MRILVVDDAEDSREIIEAALLSGGYRDLHGASSGWDALKFLDIGCGDDRSPPKAEIILLDIMMPELDGIETCARIRSDPRYADTPIIMVTSLDDMDSLANAFLAGANDYINKPLNRIELIARVRAALKLKGELERRLARERELLKFLSTWGDRHVSDWVDENTGLFVGAIGEAYLTAVSERHPGEAMSVLALAIDHLDQIRVAQGEQVARQMLSQISGAVRRAAASVGVVATCYPNGLILLVVPEWGATSAKILAENLRRSIAELNIATSESVAADHVTASVAVATGRIRDGVDRVQLLTRAISNVQHAAAAEGNRLIALNGMG